MKIPWCSTRTRMLTLSYKNFIPLWITYGFVDGLDLSADGLDSLLKLCHLDYFNTLFRLPCYSYQNKRLSLLNAPLGLDHLQYTIKVLKYSSQIHVVYLAVQQQKKLRQFPVCANIGVLFTLDILSQACEKHIQTRFSLQQFRFWSITKPIMLCHVSVHSGAFCLRHRARDPISVAFFDRVALFSDFNHLFELLDQILHPIAVAPFIYWNYAQKTFLKRSLRIL